MRILIPSPLQSYSGGLPEVEEIGSTLAELLSTLDARFPGIRFRMIDEQDRVRSHIWFFIDGVLVRDIAHRLDDKAEIKIVCALSGG